MKVIEEEEPRTDLIVIVIMVFLLMVTMAIDWYLSHGTPLQS